MSKSSSPSPFNRFAVAYGKWITSHRLVGIISCILIAFGAAIGGKNLTFKNDYQYFFSKENPQLNDFKALQKIYTKNDNVMFIVAPASGDVFTPAVLKAVEELTEESWQLPFAIRVDSVTNFQHTESEEDDLLVANLYDTREDTSIAAAKKARSVSTTDPLTRERLVREAGSVTGVNVTVELPEKSPDEATLVVTKAREIVAAFAQRYPDITIRLSGMAVMSNAFAESAMLDMATLVPAMYAVIVLFVLICLRSFWSTIGTVIVIAGSTLFAMGTAGHLGIPLTPPSASAPTMILTLAVADSIHFLVGMLTAMRGGLGKREAIIESLRVNLQPIFLTSVTTIIGFLSMNFSDAPPFRDLGNITAMGVAAAFFFSVVFLPAFMASVPLRVRQRDADTTRGPMNALAEWVIGRQRPLLIGGVITIALLSAAIPRNILDDQFVEYFDERVEFRRDAEFMMDNLTGIYTIEFSLDSGEESGISDPTYLAHVEAFATWWRAQPKVLHVATYTDIMKRLNRNMHSDDDAFYRLPESRELAAQYLLLYEMSLPAGLDINNQINVNKSSTRFTVTTDKMSTRELRAAAATSEQWLKDNAPTLASRAVSSTIMFAHISERNIKGMLTGTTMALVLISGILIVALRSWKYGLLSLVPNLSPAAMAFGVWALLVGQVGMALSVVTAMSLGIVVDDTVHFLSKYLRGRREQGLSPEDAVRYAFRTVGKALWVTSAVLMAGFIVLSQSAFELNSSMGRLTAIVIGIALIADFFFLPPLLILVDNWTYKKSSANSGTP